MILSIYDIRDSLTGFKEHLFTAINDAEALRTFAVLATTEGSYVSVYAKDIDLFKIGELETQTGKLSGTESGPVYLQNAKVIKDTKEAKEKNDVRKQV